MPEGSALSYIDAAGAGQIILAGSIAPNEALSDFSNPAGSVALYANAFAVAPGELVIASLLEDNGTYSSWQLGGTSFAAPHIAGAAAILLQAFPTLTAEEVVEILLTTAVDLGAPGVDPVFGNGLIDLAAALSPQGTQSISVKTAGGVEIFNLSQSGLIAGPAFGDVFGSARGPGRAVFLDSYDRAYGMNLGDRSRATSPALNFEQILATERNYAGGGLSFGPNNHLSIAVERTEGKDPLWFDRDALGQDGRADFKTVKLGWTSPMILVLGLIPWRSQGRQAFSIIAPLAILIFKAKAQPEKLP
jgi:hypothetical protein